MHTLRTFLKERLLEIFFIAICIQLMTNAFSIYLGDRPIFIILTAFVLILLIALISAVHDMMNEKKRNGGRLDFNLKRKGIIFTLGLKSNAPDSVAMKVIKKLSPECCGFIGTKKTSEAHIGKSIAESVGLAEDCFREKVVDPTNIKEVRDDTEHLIKWMLDKGLNKDDIVVDITGGTAIMSVAAYMAADENRIDSQYIYSEYSDNKPVEGSQKAMMVTEYEKR